MVGRSKVPVGIKDFIGAAIRDTFAKKYRVMRKIGQAFCLFSLLMVASCQFSDTEEFRIGEEFIDSHSGIVLIDTMKFSVSTVLVDSFSTSSSSRLLIGGVNDRYSGQVSCMPYFELTSGSFTIGDDDLVFDSLVVVMHYDTFYLGDTTRSITLGVHQVTEPIELNESDYLTNNSAFETAAVPLGSRTFRPEPNSNEEFTIRLNPQFGKRLFDMVIDKNDTLTSDSKFKDFFHGLAFVTEGNPNIMVGLSADSSNVAPGLRIYYHEEVYETEQSDKTYFTIPYDDDGIHFNHFDRDFGGSLMAGIETKPYELPVSGTEYKAVVQSGSGLYAKVRIPGIQHLTGIASKVAFISATLKLTPYEGSWDSNNPLPDSLGVFIADRKNNITSQLSRSDGSLVYALATSNGEFDNQPYYLADVTIFFNSLLAAEEDKEQFIFIGPPSSAVANSAQSVVFGLTNKLASPAALEVYCYIDKN